MSVASYNAIVLSLAVLLIWAPWLWRYKIKPYFATNELHKQLKNHPRRKELIQTEQFLYDLYDGMNTAAISKKERKRLGIDDDAFTYGEIEFLPFYTVLEKTQPQVSDVFYDLGSGAGKAVFAAASFFTMSKAYGVELLPELCDVSKLQKTKAEAIAKTNRRPLTDVEFFQDDYLKHDISDGDIVFINATCLGYPAWEKILDKLLGLKKGSRVIVTSKKIQHAAFDSICQSFALMSWGMNSVNIYKKII